jgi:two-component system LytT family response regulator
MKILIVDDEAPARLRLAEMLEKLRETEPDLEVVGEADNGLTAVDAIERLRPDLVLLDVKMPHLNGFEVIKHLSADPPAIIFVTGYDQYAIAAFEVCAVDFLLKPVEPERLSFGIGKARKELRSRERSEQIERLLAKVNQGNYLKRVFSQKKNCLQPLRLELIYAFVANEELVYALTESERHLVNHRLRELEERLDPSQFVRTHRGVIVNLSHIKEIAHDSRKGDRVTLANGKSFPISRRFSAELQKRILS